MTGEPPYPNAKVYSLDRMLQAAQYDLLVMADSDIRVTRGMLATIAAEFQDARLGLATCPYRAVPGRSFWTTLEAVGLNTEFIGGVLVARMLDGMKFALGPTIAARRATLEGIGGFDAVKDFLAEDFVMGKLAAARGDGVILSSYVIEHHIGAQSLGANLRHRLRWNRSTRRSRPAGYVGQVFTNPLPLALLLWAVAAGVVAGGGGDAAVARGGGRGDGGVCAARRADGAAVFPGAGAGRAELRDVGGGLLREYHLVAGPEVLLAAGRTLRLSGVAEAATPKRGRAPRPSTSPSPKNCSLLKDYLDAEGVV